MENNYSKDIPKELKFPRTINHKTWMIYLGRYLSHNERYLLEDYRAEKHMNIMMKGLYEQCIKKKLYVPELTDMDGNCLFQSLIYHGICTTVPELRSLLAGVMYFYKNYSNFFPENTSTLDEIFMVTNEVEYVSLKINETEKEYYKYSFDAMCQDLSNVHSWSRLPTQLILMVISYIFKVEIIVISNSNEYEHKINVFENAIIKPELKIIYLGHLGESHYVPIDVLEDDEEIQPIFYNDAKLKLLEWAEKMETIKINNYFEQLKKDEMLNNNIELNTQNIPESPQNKQDKNSFSEIDLSKISSPDEINYTVYF